METEIKKETYEIDIKCTNCDYGKIYLKSVKIQKGITVEGFLNYYPCPRCGNETIIQKH